jgi:hypothetical protein
MVPFMSLRPRGLHRPALFSVTLKRVQGDEIEDKGVLPSELMTKKDGGSWENRRQAPSEGSAEDQNCTRLV